MKEGKWVSWISPSYSRKAYVERVAHQARAGKEDTMFSLFFFPSVFIPRLCSQLQPFKRAASSHAEPRRATPLPNVEGIRLQTERFAVLYVDG